MIITNTAAAGTPLSHPRWISLARRGMLWSEVQVFDLVTAEPDGHLASSDPAYVEVFLCASGSAQISEPDTDGPAVRLLEGQYIVQAANEPPLELSAGSSGATVIRVRLLPSATTAALPPRHPALTRPAAAHPGGA
ncbi:hypothetical protein [Actinoplanes sp. NPDC026670]|uniref:hypothetical protein n=1 Tax=Actinoplanes sp. NPDC026670 TaxID=3154700 RepID=UPI00340336EA